MRFLFLLYFFVSGSYLHFLNAQSVLECGQESLRTSTIINRRADSLELAYQRTITACSNQSVPESSPPPYVLPVVFHIIHLGGPEELDPIQVQASLDLLNESFANTAYYDQGTGVNTQIQFCLAQRTPDNQATNGITYHASNLTDINSSNDLAMKNLARWDPTQYINIYVVRSICTSSCGVAGYAYLPSAHGLAVDGIVLEANYVGSSEANNSVLTHEMGHYLGLYHTFQGGCTNNDCTTDGDRVCDTPPDQSTVAVPCSGTANSCTTDTDSGLASDQNDMFNNYMDYGNLGCYNALTQGQTDRMYFFIEGIRSSLLESQGCQTPCPAPVVTDFSHPFSPANEINAGQTVTFTNQSINAISYEWYVNGVLVSTSIDLTYTFSTEGNYTIRLIAYSDDDLCLEMSYQENIRASCILSAAFSSSPADAVLGSLVTFLADDPSADNYTWSFNGNPVANGQSYDHLFDQPGIFEVCLIVELDSCQREQCRFFYINAPDTGGGDDCFGETYFSMYGFNEADYINAGPVLLSINGNIWHSIILDNQIHLQLLSPDGNILQSHRINTNSSGGSMRITAINRLTDESLLIVGYSGTGNSNFTAFYLRFNPNTDQVLYYETFDHRCRIVNTIPIPGLLDHFLLLLDISPSSTSNSSNESWIIDLDAITGDVAANWNYQTNQGGPHTLSHGFFRQGSLLATGRIGINALTSSFRAAVAQFTTTNNLDQLQLFHQPGNTSARLYGQQLLPINDGFYSLHNGNPSGVSTSNNYWAYISQWGQDNNLIWTREIRFPGSSRTVIYEMKEQDGIIYLYGNATTDQEETLFFLAAIDAAGNLLWANRYITNGLENRVGGTSVDGYTLLTNSHLFAITNVADGNSTIASGLLKVDLDGNIDDECVTTIPISLTITEVDPSAEFFQLNSTSRSPNPLALSASVSNPELNRYTSCQDTCTSSSGDCFLTGTQFAQVLDGEVGDEIQAHSMTPDGNGGLIMMGSSESQIFLHRLGQDGQATGTYNIDIPTEGGKADIIALESTNNDKILFGGILPPRPGMNRTGFFACFDLLTNSLEWWREFDDDAEIKGMHQIANTNEFILTGSRLWQGNSINSSLVVQRRNLSDGSLTGTLYREYEFDSRSDQVLNSQLIGNNLYLACRYSGPGGVNQMRAAFTVIDIGTGNELISMRASPEFNSISRTYCTSVVVNSQGIYALYRGDLNGTGTTAVSRVYLAHLSQNGQWIWGHQYDINDFNGEYGLSLSVLENDLIISGNGYGPGDLFTMRVSQNDGAMIWSKGIASDNGNDLEFPLRGKGHTQVLGNSIFIASSQRISPTEQRPEIIVLDENGNGPSTNCLNIYDLNVTTSNLEEWIEMSLEDWPAVLNDEVFSLSSTSTLFTQLTPCLDTCQNQVEEICDNGIDDDGNGFTDCEDPVLAQECCCLESPELSLPPDTTNCPDWPLIVYPEGSTTGLTLNWSDGTTADSLVITDYGSFHFIATDSCGRSVSDTIVVAAPFLPAPPELGPDIFICDNGVVEIDAGPGFATYLWSDLTTEQIGTFYDPGTYWLRVTDSCGNVYSDTVAIEITLATSLDLIDEIRICPNDSAQLSLTGFGTYSWFPRDVLNCNDCPNVTFYPPLPGDSSIFTLVVSDGNGCFSTDSIMIIAESLQGTNEVARICPGEVYDFNGDTLTAAGTYTRPSFCGGTDTLQLIINDLPDPVSIDSSICAGDSLLIFGQFFFTSGQYFDTIPAFNGCDSVRILNLSVIEPPVSLTQLNICAGDSVLIFDSYQSVAGSFQRSFPLDDSPCDSLAIVELVVDSLPDPVLSVATECGAPTATVLIGNLTAQDLLQWSQPDINGSQVELPNGRYGFSVTNSAGCTTLDTVEINIPEPVELELLVDDPLCPAGEDGSISINPAGTNSQVFFNGNDLGPVDNITSLGAGSYDLTIIDSLGCEQSFEVRLDDPRGFFILLPEDTTLRIGDILRIQSRLFNLDPGGASYQWLPADYLDCDSCSVVFSQPQQSVEYLLTVTDSLGCQSSDAISIQLDRRERIFVPSAFSPNTDGVNDVFLPYFGPEVSAVESMQIFERWGGLVYERADFPPNEPAYGWDGTRDGQRLDANVFIYQIRFRLIDGRVLTVAGDVTLLR